MCLLLQTCVCACVCARHILYRRKGGEKKKETYQRNVVIAAGIHARIHIFIILLYIVYKRENDPTVKLSVALLYVYILRFIVLQILYTYILGISILYIILRGGNDERCPAGTGRTLRVKTVSRRRNVDDHVYKSHHQYYNYYIVSICARGAFVIHTFCPPACDRVPQGEKCPSVRQWCVCVCQ